MQGGTAAGKVWREFMYPYLEDSPVIEFAEPDSTGKSTYIKDPWCQVRHQGRRVVGHLLVDPTHQLGRLIERFIESQHHHDAPSGGDADGAPWR